MKYNHYQFKYVIQHIVQMTLNPSHLEDTLLHYEKSTFC